MPFFIAHRWEILIGRSPIGTKGGDAAVIRCFVRYRHRRNMRLIWILRTAITAPTIELTSLVHIKSHIKSCESTVLCTHNVAWRGRVIRMKYHVVGNNKALNPAHVRGHFAAKRIDDEDFSEVTARWPQRCAISQTALVCTVN